VNEITFGKSVRRREDDRFVSGRGQYTDDVNREGALWTAFARAPVASAKILSVDVSAALEVPGVVAVLTAEDLATDGIPDFSVPIGIHNIDGSPTKATPRPLLARDRIRFLAEPVAMVIAETSAIAQDAIELVAIDYDDIPAVLTPADAGAEGAALLWDDRPANKAFHWRAGDVEGTAKALASSHHVARLSTHITRVSAMPMEPRSALAYVDENGKSVLQLSHQNPHALRANLCEVFGLGRDDVRVLIGDVGGSFGMKSAFLREEALVFWAARRLNRPVRWTATRSETFLSDEQGRDVYVDAELGLDADGRFTAFHVRYDINVGAYLSGRSAAPVLNFGGIAGVYTTPYIVGEAAAYFTNTPPTAPYRGAGRPDATYVIERIIDIAAQEMGIDPAELRRRNLIPPEAMPYQTPFLFRYDCGEFERNMNRALEMAEYEGFPARQRQARERGKLRGLGIANPIEVAAGPYAKPGKDFATIRAHADGTVTLYAGAMSVGQGLDTALSSLVAERLGLPLENVRYVQGDTDAMDNGKGSGGSAALTVGGSAIVVGVDALLEKGREIAAEELEAAAFDIEYVNGSFRIVGSDRQISLADVAAIAEQRAENAAGLSAAGEFIPPHATFPNGCHVCEVEIDPETGRTEVIRYVSVEDVGRVLNPLLVEGQIHGGVAQGLGQVLMEEIRFGSDGQLVSGSFMDYAIPRADDLPMIESDNLETPTELNPLGVKGVGEAGTVGGIAAAMNAVNNALAQVGVRHFDMPATPSRVWEAIQNAQATKA